MLHYEASQFSLRLQAHYTALRARLRTPPNAVPDRGIDLSRPPGLKGYQVERRPLPDVRTIIKKITTPEIEPTPEAHSEQAQPEPESTPIPPTPREYPRIRDIQITVCQAFNLKLMHLLADRRTLEVVVPRQIAMYLSKELTPHSLPEIGRRFNNRDHTTVLHATRKIAKQRAHDVDLDKKIAEIEATLTASLAQ